MTRTHAILSLLICTAALHAASSNTADSALVLGEIDVSAFKEGPLSTYSIFSSVDVLGGDQIESENVLNSWQLFDRLPGIELTEFKQGAESGKVSFRAFNGEGEINAVKLLIDGIASNTNDGNMRYMDMIFPLDIEAIEVVRGTNDPRYGLYNIAGNVNMITKQGGNYLKGRATLGTFNTKEAQIGFGWQHEGFSQNYFIGAQTTEGYRDHADSKKHSLAGKWFYTSPNEHYSIGLIARDYSHDADEPGYLTQEEFDEDVTASMSRNATDADERRMQQVSGHFDAKLFDTLNFSAKTYYNHYKNNRWVTFSTTQQERVSNESHIGVLSTLTWRPNISAFYALALEGGLSSEHQRNKSERYSSVDQVRTAQTRNQIFDFDTTGGYVQALIQPIASLKLIPAYRIDQVSGSYTNEMTDTRYDANDYGLIHQPKFSVIYSLLEHYSVYGNWGQTFQVGVGTATYKVNQSDDLEASINTGWEMGFKFHPFAWLNGRIALWQQIADNEARRKLNDPDNDSENIGKTKRSGQDIQLNITPNDQIALWAACSLQDSKILKADSSSPLSEGKEIDHVPHTIYSGGIEYHPVSEWTLSLNMHGQSDYYLERTNSTEKFGEHLLFNIGASYRPDETIGFDLQVRNLSDDEYEYVWFDGSQTLHSAGDGRALYAGITLNY